MLRAGSPTLAIGLRINPYEYRCDIVVVSKEEPFLHEVPHRYRADQGGKNHSHEVITRSSLEQVGVEQHLNNREMDYIDTIRKIAVLPQVPNAKVETEKCYCDRYCERLDRWDRIEQVNR